MAKRLLLTLFLIPFLSSCSNISRVEQSRIEGTQFNHYLGRGYQTLALYEKELSDNADADYFSRKALQSHKNLYVEPTLIAERDVPQQHLAELAVARSQLIDALFTLKSPETWEVLAYAQVQYDCWIENLEEKTGMEQAALCKANFLKAMDKLLGRLDLSEAFMVFFDFNSSELTPKAKEAIAVVAKAMKDNPSLKVVLTGNTDTVGPESYNDGLSLRRAKTVQKALHDLGVAKDRAELYAEGEHNLLVQTPDNVREPRNRRVDILMTKK